MTLALFICSECHKDNLKYSINLIGSTQTLMSVNNYYDEKGHYHEYDDNYHEGKFLCSNDHAFTFKSQKKCWCQE